MSIVSHLASSLRRFSTASTWNVWVAALIRRGVEAYEAAWRAHAVLPVLEPVFEPDLFPIRIQTAADLEAAKFELLSWADPPEADGPASPDAHPDP